MLFITMSEFKFNYDFLKKSATSGSWRRGYEVYQKDLILEAFAENTQIDKICVICPAESVDYAQNLIEKYKIPKVAWVAAGGNSRRESSYIGVSLLAREFDGKDIVLIHDGARPNVSQRIIDENIALAKKLMSKERFL